MSVVRPEFGPTLPEVLAPRLRRLPRAAQLALAGLAALVVVLVAVAYASRGDDRTVVVVRDADPAYNFVHDDALRLAGQPRDGRVALRGRGLAYRVAPLELPPFRGDAAGILPIYVETLVREMEREYDGFVRRQEGRANINRQQGYELYFQFKRDGATWYGRRLLLLPDPTQRKGADLRLEVRRTPAVPRFSAVGQNGPMKVALRSFRFGTERP
ncbi:hypothetical protein [Conexibacter sp. SYSU D00693]|uniref:hypothetical protein n=1 Tax=Conexibacter sp. SYSU D00693 TaxID=2812560 RepID=UPI00196ACAC5|nr:hypothetical protein [Conexibacter sp. SYSU D00693]